MNEARDTTKTVMISHREGKNGEPLTQGANESFLTTFYISAVGVGIDPMRNEWTVKHEDSNLAAVFGLPFFFLFDSPIRRLLNYHHFVTMVGRRSFIGWGREEGLYHLELNTYPAGCARLLFSLGP